MFSIIYNFLDSVFWFKRKYFFGGWFKLWPNLWRRFLNLSPYPLTVEVNNVQHHDKVHRKCLPLSASLRLSPAPRQWHTLHFTPAGSALNRWKICWWKFGGVLSMLSQRVANRMEYPLSTATSLSLTHPLLAFLPFLLTYFIGSLPQ